MRVDLKQLLTHQHPLFRDVSKLLIDNLKTQSISTYSSNQQLIINCYSVSFLIRIQLWQQAFDKFFSGQLLIKDLKTGYLELQKSYIFSDENIKEFKRTIKKFLR